MFTVYFALKMYVVIVSLHHTVRLIFRWDLFEYLMFHRMRREAVVRHKRAVEELEKLREQFNRANERCGIVWYGLWQPNGIFIDVFRRGIEAMTWMINFLI